MPGPGRHGDRPDPGPAPAREVLVAPRAYLAGGDNWTVKHQAWITAQRFDDLALEATYAHYRATLSAREAAVTSIDADWLRW